MRSVKADPALVGAIRRHGTFDPNACLQCGACTLECTQKSNAAAFPRRTLRLAQLGLRQPLRASLEPWLCSFCGDCSTTCPRESEPAEGMMTLRRYLAGQYDWTGLASRIHRSKVWEIGALLFVVGIFFLVGILYHFSIGLDMSDFVGEAPYVGIEHSLSGVTIVTWGAVGFALLMLVGSALRMWWLTMRDEGGARLRVPLPVYLREARELFVHTVTQRRLKECVGPWRYAMHLSLVWGCILMLVLVLFGLTWFQTDKVYPLYHPQRWLGYLATAAMVVPLVVMLADRVRRRHSMYRFSRHTDWTFPVLLLLCALSGIAVHVLRYLGLPAAALYLYVAHLAITYPLLVVEIPFGKWSHALYRPLAIYLQAVKERARQPAALPEAVASHAR